MTPPRPPSPLAFSLTELLIVVAVIGALLLLAFPAYQRVAAQGRQTQCLANLRQYGAAAVVFISENGGIPRWDGLGQTQATEGSTYPDWEKWVRPYLHHRLNQRLRCPNIPVEYRTVSTEQNTFNYSGNSALAIYYPTLRNLPVPASKVALAAETYGYGGFNHAVHLNMTMWGLSESSASRPNSDFSDHESPRAQYHGTPSVRALNLFFLDGHAQSIPVPKGTDWREDPLYGTPTNNGYYFDRRQFRNLSQSNQ